MGEYKIEAERFGLSDTAIHLLRNRYNYETIDLFDLFCPKNSAGIKGRY